MQCFYIILTGTIDLIKQIRYQDKAKKGLVGKKPKTQKPKKLIN